MRTTTMAEHPEPGKPIPTPPDFPVVWEKPGDASLYWERNLFHYPDPIAPLEFEFGVKTYNVHGLNPSTRRSSRWAPRRRRSSR